jgi:hypothetical protein
MSSAPTPPFQVFIDGSTGGPDGLANLANIMAQRYGMPETDLLERLGGGRTRVKTTPDLEVARAMARELSQLGARCVIVDASGAPVEEGGRPSVARTATPAPRPSGQMQSGLAAATSGAAQDLGVMGSGGALSLAALDGNDAPPPPRTMTARAVVAPVAAPAAPGADQFAPPEAEAADLTIDLASPPRRASAPVAVPPSPGASSGAIAVPRTQTPAALPAPATAAPGGVAARGGPLARLADPTLRFVVGVVLCLGLAFIPAFLVDRARAVPALAEVDRTLQQRQAQVVTTEDWQQLDTVRATFRARKADTQREHAITMAAIWLVLAGGLAYVWFRRLDWDRLISGHAAR